MLKKMTVKYTYIDKKQFDTESARVNKRDFQEKIYFDTFNKSKYKNIQIF